jgi:hypothetical protein
VGHEKFGVSFNPAFAVKTQAASCDNQMNMRMPFHVGAKGMKDNEDAHAHALDLARPLLYRLNGYELRGAA